MILEKNCTPTCTRKLKEPIRQKEMSLTLTITSSKKLLLLCLFCCCIPFTRAESIEEFCNSLNTSTTQTPLQCDLNVEQCVRAKADNSSLYCGHCFENKNLAMGTPAETRDCPYTCDTDLSTYNYYRCYYFCTQKGFVLKGRTCDDSVLIDADNVATPAGNLTHPPANLTHPPANVTLPPSKSPSIVSPGGSTAHVLRPVNKDNNVKPEGIDWPSLVIGLVVIIVLVLVVAVVFGILWCCERRRNNADQVAQV